MINIAIDGPSGAGKSTIAKLLAKRLNIMYLDTGAMYRCLGLKALNTNISITDNSAVQHLLDTTTVDVKYLNGVQKVYLDGVDVSEAIRQHEVSKMASDVSAVPSVRLKLASMQREIASKNDCVLDGRDIGSYVLPNAEYKFYLTATAEIRALRRQKELQEKGQDVDYNQLLNDINQRDYNDMNRKMAPLVCLPEAIKIETDNLSIEQVLEKFLNIIQEN